MTKVEEPVRRSDRIALIIAKANQVAVIDWLHAVLEEQAEPIRAELTELKSKATLSRDPGMPITGNLLAPARGSKAASAYWSRLTPEQRSAEMKKRRAKWSAGKAQALTAVELDKLHPRDSRSPRHAAWIKMMSKVQKRRFDSMTPRARKQWHAAMLSGRVNGVAHDTPQ